MVDYEISKLLQDGPKLSSILARELELSIGISAAAARKRIERAKTSGDLHSLESMKFRRNEQFLFLAEHSGTTLLRKSLLHALEATKSAYRLPLRGLAARGGIVPLHLIDTFTGLPLKDSTNMLEELLNLRVIEESYSYMSGRCLRLGTDTFGESNLSIKRMAGRLAAEDLVLAAVRDWLKLQGLVTAEKISVRNRIKPVQFGYYSWDLVAPSFIQPFITKRGADVLNGFIVADVILGRKLTYSDVEYFLSKANNIKAKPNNRPFIAFLFADWFEKDAFALGRKNGLIFTTPKNFLGAQFSLFLDFIVQEFEGRTPEEHEIKTFDICSRALLNFQHLPITFEEIRQSFFALVAGHCLRKLFSGTVFYDFQMYKNEGSNLLLTEPYSHVVNVQCRHEKMIELDTLKRWLNETVKNCYEQLAPEKWYREVPFRFLYWTTGEFTEECHNFIKSSALQNLPFIIETKDRTQLSNLVRDIADPGIYQSFERWLTI